MWYLLNKSLLVFLILRVCLSTQDCAWNACNPTAEDDAFITAHLIPHTHDDLGWIKTVDQYYYGSKPELVPVGVQYIYNTVIDELLKNPERRFSFAETGFLMRWFSSHGDFERHELQKLVKNGQIEIIGGGWVQNDEATAHYVDIIDQMTLGLQRLRHIFGECGKPRTGWQIDPFGHSREMANIYAQMGYKSLYFARIHYLEKEKRLQNKTLEFNWQASDNLINESTIFTGAFFNDNYGPPEGFCWDALCGDDPIMDNEDLEDYNVDEKVSAFVDHVRKQAAYQKTNQVMLLMGSDFQYTNANSWYTNLDKLIKYVNADHSKKVKVIYSTPACYTQAVQKKNNQWTTKSDDFFPYASSAHSYWIGFFTSRPTFKGLIRKASSLLQLAKRLDAVFDLEPTAYSEVEILREASALNQHHDAVTGTAKENVTRDYEKQLARGMNEVEKTINIFFNNLNATQLNANLIFCPLINETICESLSGVQSFTAVFFNGNGQPFKGVIRIPTYGKPFSIRRSGNEITDFEYTSTYDVASLRNRNRAPYLLYVYLSIPPIGYVMLDVSVAEIKKSSPSSKKTLSPKNVTIGNAKIQIFFDENGYLNGVYDKTKGVHHALRQEFLYYEGVDSSDPQPSGAYIFRPKSLSPIQLPTPVEIEVIQKSFFSEVRQTINPWTSQIIRLVNNTEQIEFEWIVGPIPKERRAPITKEIVTRYTSDIATEDVFYTDSNGRQAMRRVYGQATSFKYSNDEPVAGNYYPITSFGYIKDERVQLTVLTDRAQGMTSRNGFIEIMIHRRCFYDDHFGVEEALDEPGNNGNGLVAMGKHVIFFSSVDTAADTFRPLAVQLFNDPVFSFSPDPNHANRNVNRDIEWSALKAKLPEYLNLLSLEKWDANRVLIRFEHIFHSSDISKDAVAKEFDFQDLFKTFSIVSVRPLLLGGNQNKTGVAATTKFTIRPSEILTFEIEVNFKKHF